MKKILNLFSLFFSVISLCAATLVCHIIFIYPNLNNNSSGKSQNISSQNTAIMQADNSAGIVNTYQDNYSLPETASDSNIPASYQDTSGQTVPLPETTSSDNISLEYQSALNKANDYSNIMYMSKASIYDQLTSEYGERFSSDAAQYAIDNMTADWNSNALQKAKDYSDTMYMSKSAIYDQLISDYGEKFTPSEAQYAVDNLVADWNYNALQKAKDYLATMNMSADAIHDQLTSEYGERFTPAEADYAVSNLSSSNNTGNNPVLYTMPVEQGNSNTNYVASDPVQATGSQGPNENNFNTYNNLEQQQTTASYVLNTSTLKIHISDCRDVPKIAPENYSTSNLSIGELESQGYTRCGHCLK